MTAVVATAEGQEILSLVNNGVWCEVLSWEMDVQEPPAASLISQAFNEFTEMAMRTAEITAIWVLKGEIIVQMSKDVGQQVAYQTVVDAVSSQLGTAIADPDLPEVFDFLISNGVGKNFYIDDFLDCTAFVSNKKREFRLSAFGSINKMDRRAACSKMAVGKRAYRTKPYNGFCANRESVWG